MGDLPGSQLPRADWLAEWKWSVHGRKEDRTSCPDNRREGERSHERFQTPEAYSFFSRKTTDRLIAAFKRARPPKNHKYILIPRSSRLFPFRDGTLSLSLFSAFVSSNRNGLQSWKKTLNSFKNDGGRLFFRSPLLPPPPHSPSFPCISSPLSPASTSALSVKPSTSFTPSPGMSSQSSLVA